MKNVTTITKPPCNPIIIGKIGGAYGVWGWVKIISFTDRMDSIFTYTPWFILFQSRWKLMRVDSWRLLGKRYIAKIIDIPNREFAMSLTHSKLMIDFNKLPSLCNDNNEYYWNDIIGCRVMTITGNYIGCVIRILETPVHDVLVIGMNQSNCTNIKDCLIPFIQEKIIKNIDLITKIIIVDWIL